MSSGLIITLAGVLLACGEAKATSLIGGPLTFPDSTQYDNTTPAAMGLFRDVLNDPAMNQGTDSEGTGHTAVNFNLSEGPAGGWALSLYDTTPADGTTTKNLFTGSMELTADIIEGSFNNFKAPGLLALYNEGAGAKGLALTVRDTGNTDQLELYTVDSSGVSTVLSAAANNLSSGIGETIWYRLIFDLTIPGDGSFTVAGSVYHHTTSTDPNSSLGTKVGNTLNFTGNLAALGLDTSGTGEIGFAFHVVSASSTASLTNFDASAPVPEPGTWLLLCAGFAALEGLRRRGSFRRS